MHYNLSGWIQLINVSYIKIYSSNLLSPPIICVSKKPKPLRGFLFCKFADFCRFHKPFLMDLLKMYIKIRQMCNRNSPADKQVSISVAEQLQSQIISAGVGKKAESALSENKYRTLVPLINANAIPYLPDA